MTDPVLMLGIVLGEMSKHWPIAEWSWPEDESHIGGPYVVDVCLTDGQEFRLSIVDKAML